MKRKEVRDLLQKYYNRFYRFQREEWKKMWREFLTLSQQGEIKPGVKLKKRMVSYDLEGNRIEPDNPNKCSKCKTPINEVNMDLITEESDKTRRVYECLNCQNKIIIRN